jgi:hypothetical protein
VLYFYYVLAIHFGGAHPTSNKSSVRSMWGYAMNYILDYDFFHIMGDDGYLYVDNFRSFLDSEEVIRLENGYMDSISSHDDFSSRSKNWTDIRPRPLILGLPVYRRQRGKYPNGTFDGTMFKSTYPAGGSGYTLNRAALKLLQNGLLDEIFNSTVDSREDVLLGAMLSTVGVFVSVTIDKHHGGRYLGSAEKSFRFKKDDPGPANPQQMKRRFKMWHAGGLDGVRYVFQDHLRIGWLSVKD